ncbi:MAG: protoporphyrinogen oxidase [Truepera sp.]|nr:protoporphyrinogen oxidase [Truepera sp.]
MTVAIVGGGIAGLATAYYLNRQGRKVIVFEREAAAGGITQSDQLQGYTIDRGPNGFLTNVPETLELAKALGLADELAVAGELAQHRFLYHHGTLQALPTSPMAFLRTRLVSGRAKARLLCEPFAPKRPPGVDETVYEFAQRRVGAEFAEVFMRAMVLGITAGDAKAISLAALFPRLRRLEDDYGSLVRALLATVLKRRQGTGGPAGPGGRLTSFKHGGIARLTRALAEQLGQRVRTGAAVVGLQRCDYAQRGRCDTGTYTLTLASGEQCQASAVVLATPAFVSADLLAPLLPEAAAELAAIPYAGVRVLGLGFNRQDVPHPLNGFGYLVVPGEGQQILGCLWTSSLFPTQAPPGKVLLRVIGGGVFDPDFVTIDDSEALRIVQHDLRLSLGLTQAPELVHQVTWPQGIPQYLVGHSARVARIMTATQALPGLYLTGNAYYGVGLNDCVRDAQRVTRAIATAIRPANS